MNQDNIELLDAPLLSIVLVNSDALQITMDCIGSIYANPCSGSIEVILVDNCSKESPLGMVAEIFPDVVPLKAESKQGFAKNYNLGIHKAKSQYILILNNDTIVLPGALDAMVNFLRSDPSYGMVGAKLIGSNGLIQLPCARPLLTPISFIIGQLLLDPGFLIGGYWHRYQSWRLKSRASGPVPCISGACMLLPAGIIHQVGMLDEAYDFYFEDIEWCHRLQNKGYRVGYVAESEIIHLGDQSLSKVREWAKKSEFLSALRYFREYHDLSKTGAWILWGASVVNFWLRRLVLKLRGQSENALIYNRLLKWILAVPPELFSN